jgi:signal transduction histidine kinase
MSSGRIYLPVRSILGLCGAASFAMVFRAREVFAAGRSQYGATDVSSPPPAWAPFVGGIVLLGAVVGIAYALVRAARRQTAKFRDLAAYLEYERDQAQKELVQKLEQERELSKEKMQFESQLTEYEKYASLAQLALGAAHEINNPLLGILSHLELDWKDADGERRAEIEQCIEGAKRISSAVRGLLDYARQGPLTLSEVDLRQLVRDAFRFVEHQPLFRGIQLQNCVPHDLPRITADANQLSQILMNLLLNAAQATPSGGSVTVLAEKLRFSDLIELRVSDTGAGIPEDILPHVFEPFFTTKRGKGTGLGLSITRNYVRRHGGDIQLRSISGVGTAVSVTLPVRHEGQPEPVATEVIV